MTRDIALGQFIPGKSIIHRMDARVKILLLITYIVLIFCAFNFVSLGIVTAAVIAIIVISGIPVKMYLKSLKVIIVIILITSILNIFYGSGEPLVQFGIFKITLEGIYRAIFVTVRIICLILISLLLLLRLPI